MRYEKSLLLLQKASWDSRIRTYEMTESESVALPLGYIPMYFPYRIGLCSPLREISICSFPGSFKYNFRKIFPLLSDSLP